MSQQQQSQQQVVQKLSATKQRLSLGEVKKTEKANNVANSRKIVRSTVVNPNDFEWPFITEEDEKELLERLSCDLKVLKFPSYHVPLSEIAKLEAGERRKYRHIYHTQRALEVGFDVANYTKLRMDISLGANCVSTAMEREILNAVIIDKDVDPPIITKLLVPIARSKNVPIVAISGLSRTCQSVFRTRCIAMGFKVNCCDVTHPFYRIYRLVTSVAQKEFQDNQERNSNQDADAIPAASTVISSPSNNDADGGKGGQKRTSKTHSESFKPPKIRKV